MDSLIAKADSIRPVKAGKSRSSLHHQSRPGQSKAKSKGKGKAGEDKAEDKPEDPTLSSIARRTAVPASLQPTGSSSKAKGKQKATPDYHPHIADKKLKAKLNVQKALASQRKNQLVDAELLLPGSAGLIETTDPLEKTWRVTQDDVIHDDGVGLEARAGRKEIVLDEQGTGAYKLRWTRNGRHLAIAGRRGFLASVDWMSGNVLKEIRLGETCRDVTYLQSHHHIAVAQARHAFIYDQDLVELHRLSALIEPAFLEFLSYHWLLACAGLPGTLSYLDTSTGTIMAQHRPKLGPPTALAQNAHNAVIYWGANNGTVSLWTPSSPTPHVRLLAHLGPITAISVDPSTGGRYLATAGLDKRVKIWDQRNYATPVREWVPRSDAVTALEWSQRGILAVASAGHVNTYAAPAIHTFPFPKNQTLNTDITYPGHTTPVLPPLYLTHPLPSGAKPAACVRWQPFSDALAIGHGKGLSSILVPGAGEPNFDSAEADPFENNKRRAEREVRGLLDKIHPDMITLNPDDIGGLAAPSKLTLLGGTVATDANGRPIRQGALPFRALPRLERLRVQGKADETEIPNSDDDDEPVAGETEEAKKERREKRDKMKMRGKNKTLKRYLRKKRKNVIDANVVALRAKIDKQKIGRQRDIAAAKMKAAGGGEVESKPSALDRFKRR
ncbi:hypothetical protein M422DRAFT_24583 [Sphaerobolus stellatus SS14]|nr:hypothetical protein M422DRAFT_24583 [Sphaerobolus stellatus SS14]